MNSRNIAKWFVYITTAISAYGTLLLAIDEELDLYALWGFAALVVACYLVSHRE